MIDHYVWLIWSSAFLIPWLGLYLGVPARRQVMLRASLLTMPFGLTEPLFVPAYWSPPSLFDLAQRTRFDLESLIFSFAIGGVGLVLYDVFTRRVAVRLPAAEQHHARHRLHRLALAAPVLAFPPLLLLPWNPIYPAIMAMGIGAIAASACRPDLTNRTWVGAVLFLTFYSVLLFGLEITVPGYIGRVWNLPALSGLLIAGLPVEELLFAAAFGGYWSAVYEHLTWSTSVTRRNPKKIRTMMFVTLAGCLMASAAAAQMASGRTATGMMAGGMMKECQAMMAEREDMMQKMKAMDVTLDQLVARMNDADGDRKVEALRAVIGDLVAQRNAMRGTSMTMEGHMIGHMMEHMGSGKMESMAMCPMMKGMATAAPKTVKNDGHDRHH